MRFVEEIVVEEFLPTYRSLLAERLREAGLTQSEVGELLGISQSAVSKYVHGDVARSERLVEHRPLQDLVDRVAEGLASGAYTPARALVETEVFVREMERGGVLAAMHEDAVPELADYDDAAAVHEPDGPALEAERTLSALRRGLATLEAAPGVAALIPAVGSNLVQALPDAAGIADVAGVPGRILDVKDTPSIPADPEFGVSEHVASVLLAARAGGADAGAALNVRYDPTLVDALAEDGARAVEFAAEGDPAETVTDAVERAGGVDAVYQTGAVGVEPICYLLGPDAPTVADRAVALATPEE